MPRMTALRQGSPVLMQLSFNTKFKKGLISLNNFGSEEVYLYHSNFSTLLACISEGEAQKRPLKLPHLHNTKLKKKKIFACISCLLIKSSKTFLAFSLWNQVVTHTDTHTHTHNDPIILHHAQVSFIEISYNYMYMWLWLRKPDLCPKYWFWQRYAWSHKKCACNLDNYIYINDR